MTHELFGTHLATLSPEGWKPSGHVHVATPGKVVALQLYVLGSKLKYPDGHDGYVLTLFERTIKMSKRPKIIKTVFFITLFEEFNRIPMTTTRHRLHPSHYRDCNLCNLAAPDSPDHTLHMDRGPEFA